MVGVCIVTNWPRIERIGSNMVRVKIMSNDAVCEWATDMERLDCWLRYASNQMLKMHIASGGNVLRLP